MHLLHVHDGTEGVRVRTDSMSLTSIGSAAVILAALMSAMRVTDDQVSDQKILLYGAHATRGMTTASTLVNAMELACSIACWVEANFLRCAGARNGVPHLT